MGRYYFYCLDQQGTDVLDYLGSQETRQYLSRPSTAIFRGTALNYAAVFNDKVLFSKLMTWHQVPSPKLFGHVKNGQVYDALHRPTDFRNLFDAPCKFVAKDRFGGEAARLKKSTSDLYRFAMYDGNDRISIGEESFSTEEFVRSLDHQMFITQELVDQHPLLCSFNPTSVNTLRLYTFWDGDDVVIPTMNLKIGGRGESVDNVWRGGVYAEVETNSGLLTGRVASTRRKLST